MHVGRCTRGVGVQRVSDRRRTASAARVGVFGNERVRTLRQRHTGRPRAVGLHNRRRNRRGAAIVVNRNRAARVGHVSRAGDRLQSLVGQHARRRDRHRRRQRVDDDVDRARHLVAQLVGDGVGEAVIAHRARGRVGDNAVGQRGMTRHAGDRLGVTGKARRDQAADQAGDVGALRGVNRQRTRGGRGTTIHLQRKRRGGGGRRASRVGADGGEAVAAIAQRGRRREGPSTAAVRRGVAKNRAAIQHRDGVARFARAGDRRQRRVGLTIEQGVAAADRDTQAGRCTRGVGVQRVSDRRRTASAARVGVFGNERVRTLRQRHTGRPRAVGLHNRRRNRRGAAIVVNRNRAARVGHVSRAGDRLQSLVGQQRRGRNGDGRRRGRCAIRQIHLQRAPILAFISPRIRGELATAGQRGIIGLAVVPQLILRRGVVVVLSEGQRVVEAGRWHVFDKNSVFLPDHQRRAAKRQREGCH